MFPSLTAQYSAGRYHVGGCQFEPDRKSTRQGVDFGRSSFDV